MKQAYGDILLKRETVRDEVGSEEDPTYPPTLKSESDKETEDEVTKVEVAGLKPGHKRRGSRIKTRSQTALMMVIMCVGFQKRHM